MKRLLIFAALILLVGCGPEFLRNAHNYDPGDKTRMMSYWSCESPEVYAWGDCNWSTGWYKEIDGVQRLVAVRWCLGSALDAGYAYNAVCEDRDRYGPLKVSDLGPQPHMHCRLVGALVTVGDAAPINQRKRVGKSYRRVKAATYLHGESNPPEYGSMSMVVIGKGDNDTETRGHEVAHAHWQGDWHGQSWREANPINTVGVQPPSFQDVPKHRWIPPDPPPDYNDHWAINRGDEPGVLLEELTQ
jgi:hypothetical protein